MFYAGNKKILYTENRRSVFNTLIHRGLILACLILFTAVVVYLHRSELKASHPLNFLDTLYFTIISISTVGYGDIVPNSSWFRMFDAFFITIMRFVTWFIVVTTAAEIIIPRIMEDYMIKKMIERTKNHVIICGFGTLGEEILSSLLKNGEDPRQIVAIDKKEERAVKAAEMGISALRGNAENENFLEMADVVNAREIFLCTDQDHTNLMICLTVKSMNEKIRVITIARENENVKLFAQAKADHVVNLPEIMGREMLRFGIREREEKK